MELIITIITICFIYYNSFRNPTKSIIAFLILETSFLGFVHIEILVGGVDYIALILNMVLLPAIFSAWRKNKNVYAKRIILFLAIFYIYGLLKPLFDGNQNFVQSVKTSKTFLYYIFVVYVIIKGPAIDMKKVSNIVVLIALYFSTLYILFYVLGLNIIVPCYEKNSQLQCHYDSYIALGLIFIFSFCSSTLLKKYRNYLSIYLLIGLSCGGFFALFSTSLLISLFLNVRSIYKKDKQLCASLIILFIVLLILSIGVFFNDILNTINISIAEQSHALSGREIYNEFRWTLIDKQLMFGYGFLSSDSEPMLVYGNQSVQYMRTFSFIDAGYVDLLGRFGVLGSIIFLLLPIYLIINNKSKSIKLPFVLFLIQLLFVNLTWSVFSFNMGIVLLGIVYTILLYNYENSKYYRCV